jgi:glycosyltransferase involved in cell wall biosynthesis
MAAPDAPPSRRAVALVTIEYPPMIGGVAACTQRLARVLHGAGYEVHVIVPSFVSSREVTRHRVEEATVHRIDIPVQDGLRRSSLRMLEQIKRIDREVGFSIFHSFFLLTAFPCALLAAPRRPLLISIRGGDLASQFHVSIRDGAIHALERATWITSVNEGFLAEVQRLVDVRGKSSVLRNGVEAMPESLIWTPERRRRHEIGMVGQFQKMKDAPLLVRAFSAIRLDSDPAPRLHLLGRMVDPGEERWTRTLAAELGAGERIAFHGELPRAEILQRVSRLHAYVQCSAAEGLPNALLEAAACGVPLVATAVDGMKEILHHEENALLVAHGDSLALTAAMTRVLTDDALAQRLSRGSLKLAHELSSTREHAEWLELYRRIAPNV